MQYQHDPRQRRVGEGHTIFKWLRNLLKKQPVSSASKSTGSYYAPDSDDDADIIDDHGDLDGLTDTADHPGYLTLDGLRTMLGNLLMGAFGIHLTKRATPATPASEVTVLYNDTTTERLHQLDDTGAAADLSKQAVIKLQGQQLGGHADGETWQSGKTQTDTCAVNSSANYSYDNPNNKQTEGNGAWAWTARRDQLASNFAQAWFATGGQMDYNGCNTLKLRAKVKVVASVLQGTPPSGSMWAYMYAYLNDNAAVDKTKVDIESQTLNASWRIIEADFDIGPNGLNWAVGSEEGLMFGLEFKGLDVEDPDPDPVNEWSYDVAVEWIEVIAWIR